MKSRLEDSASRTRRGVLTRNSFLSATFWYVLPTLLLAFATTSGKSEYQGGQQDGGDAALPSEEDDQQAHLRAPAASAPSKEIHCYDYSGSLYRYPVNAIGERRDTFWNATADGIGNDAVIVTTHYGRVRGKRSGAVPGTGDSSNIVVNSFLGLPYASPPVGNLRFSRPKPPKPWRGIRDASCFGAVCPQPIRSYMPTSPEMQNEDCLYLNIYAPSMNGTNTSQALHAVMVYIHGGSYRVGSGSAYAGNILAQHDVIVVTINYRIGILGFLTARHSSLEGNYGLYDQIEALHWIQLNIRAFGGDPNRVTIFGNSAGGSSVGLLALSPLSDGLYHQVIFQSGSPLAFWAVHDEKTDLDEYARQLASHVACFADLLEDLVACLRKIDWRVLIAASCSVPQLLKPGGTDSRPVVDGLLIPDTPRNLLVAGKFRRKPLMGGTVTDELTRHIWMFLVELDADWPQLQDMDIGNGIDLEIFNAAIDSFVSKSFNYDPVVSEIVRHAYTSWQHQSSPIELRDQYVKLITDMVMVAPAVEFAEYFAVNADNSPSAEGVYLYEFNHFTNASEWDSRHHEMELIYLFGIPFDKRNVDYGNFNDFDRQLSSVTMRLWSNFAKYGNPTHVAPEPEVVKENEPSPTWTRFTPDSYEFMFINANSSAARRHPNADKIKLWSRLVPFVSDHFRSRLVSDDSRTTIVALSATIVVLAVLVAVLSTACILAHRRPPSQRRINPN